MLLYSDIELAVRKSRTLETRLKREYGAQGEGLGQLVKSAKEKLPAEIVEQLNEVNRMRNEVVHEEGRNKLRNRREFVRLCQEIERSLDELKKPEQVKEMKRMLLAITFIIAATLIIFVLSQYLP